MNGLSIDEISGVVIKKELLKVVEKQFGGRNVELCIEPGSKKGDNFIGEIFRILIKRNNDNGHQEHTSLILKIAPRNLIRRQKANSRDIFLREIQMYSEVLSFFNDFQITKGVDAKVNGFNEFVQMYSFIRDEMSESLFLEDLKLRHFEMVNLRKEPITFEHVSLVMNALGKFHALSFAMKDQHPDKFIHLASLVPEQYWNMFRVNLKSRYETILFNFRSCLSEENRFDLLEKFNRKAGNDPHEVIMSLVSSAAAEPFAVICHGDVTTNNTMFRKDGQGKTVEVQLFDWQFTRCASVVTDLVLYLFCSSTKELRDKHFGDFLKIYYANLSDLLSRLGSDPQKIFPFDALLDQFGKFAANTVFVGAFLMPLLFADVETMPDPNDVAEKEHNGEENNGLCRFTDKTAFNKRVVDVFDDLIRNGYF